MIDGYADCFYSYTEDIVGGRVDADMIEAADCVRSNTHPGHPSFQVPSLQLSWPLSDRMAKGLCRVLWLHCA